MGDIFGGRGREENRKERIGSEWMKRSGRTRNKQIGMFLEWGWVDGGSGVWVGRRNLSISIFYLSCLCVCFEAILIHLQLYNFKNILNQGNKIKRLCQEKHISVSLFINLFSLEP